MTLILVTILLLTRPSPDACTCWQRVVYFAMLRSNNPDLQLKAAFALPPETVFSCGDAYTISYAVEALAGRTDGRSRALLFLAVMDPRMGVSWAAAEELTRKPDPAAIIPIILALPQSFGKKVMSLSTWEGSLNAALQQSLRAGVASIVSAAEASSPAKSISQVIQCLPLPKLFR